jgi:hypothetical protein
MQCPKCHQDLKWGDPEDSPAELAQECRMQNDCPHVACDGITCRALKDPVYFDEWKAAAEHWCSHRLLSGCSHGC